MADPTGGRIAVGSPYPAGRLERARQITYASRILPDRVSKPCHFGREGRMISPEPTRSDSMRAKVLVVDDEQDILDLVRYHLEREGYQVIGCRDGKSALELVGRDGPDLVVLDLLMPGMDGLEVCRRLRQSSTIPIIMLTAKADETDKVVGLELGADDYVTKPFSPRELVARVRAILRRGTSTPDEQVFTFGELVIDFARHQLKVAGRGVSLTAKEMELLKTLVQAKGRVLGREFLLERVWGYERATEIESRTVDVHVRRLREKLGPAARRIETVKGVGYRFDQEG